MRRALIALLVACAATLVGVAPARAAAPPTIDTMDWTTTPGHVTGTVSSASAWVHVAVGSNGSWPGDKGLFPVDADTHQATFDLETWGMRSSGGSLTEVGVTPCTGSTFDTCTVDGGQPLAVSAPFQPTDVRPDVMFSPADGRIGVGEQLTVTVSDPQGGGLLKAWWAGDQGGSTAAQVLDRNGTTQLTVGEGTGTIRVQRCSGVVSSVSEYYCDSFDPEVAQQLVVRRKLTTAVTTDGTITAAHRTLTVTVDTDSAGTPDLDLVVRDENGQPVAVPQPDVDATTDAGGVFTFRLDAGDLPSNASYALAGTVTIDDPEFGLLTGPLKGGDGETASFHVDTVAPTNDTLTLSRTAIHPRAIDALAAHRTTTITLGDADQLDYQDTVEIRDAAGTTVRRLEPDHASGTVGTVVWDGRDAAAALVPPGTYRVVVVDMVGNVATLTRTVSVSHATGVLRTFRRTVSAAGSQAGPAFRGRCSTLRRPSLRGWAGSLGFYANTRCGRQTWNASAVSTLHRLRTPSAVKRLDVQVQLTGGAAKAAPRSRGLLRYLAAADPADATWVDEYWSSPRVTTHTGPRRSASGMIGSDHYLYWGFATAFKSRYDVRSFTVSVRYYSWQ